MVMKKITKFLLLCFCCFLSAWLDIAIECVEWSTFQFFHYLFYSALAIGGLCVGSRFHTV